MKRSRMKKEQYTYGLISEGGFNAVFFRGVKRSFKFETINGGV